MKEERTVTKSQVLSLCPKVKPHLDNILSLLENRGKSYDAEVIAMCLNLAVTELSNGLKWHGGNFRQDTGISREALIQALVPARAKIGAAETLAKEHYLQVGPEQIWKKLASALIAIQQVLGTTTFKDKIPFSGTVGLSKSTDIF